MTALPTATREEALSKGTRIPIETPSLSGSISLKGGLIDDIKLLNYTETVDPKSPKVVLFSPLGAPHAYFAEYGWQGAARSQVPLPDSETVWQTTEARKADARDAGHADLGQRPGPQVPPRHLGR